MAIKMLNLPKFIPSKITRYIRYVIAYFCHFSPSLTITNLFYSFSPSVFNDGQWSVGSVLDSLYIPLLYEQILKERRKELIGMNEYMTDKEKELQVINESLRHDLQVSRINYQSLQEALLESGIMYIIINYMYIHYNSRSFVCLSVCTYVTPIYA